MPYKSQDQRAYMHIHYPDIAKRWDAEYGGGGKDLPKKKKKRKGMLGTKLSKEDR